MNVFKALMVYMVMLPGFAQIENWEKFNSSILIEVTRPHGIFTCTGVAVSSKTILTAAHCLEGAIEKVRIFTQAIYNPKENHLEISDYKLHPYYNSVSSFYRYDLAKIQLRKKLPHNIKYYPIHTSQKTSGNLYRFGYGERNKSNIRTVIFPILKKFDQENAILELHDVFSRSGDSGGPIFIENDNQLSLMAIHSTFSYGPEGNFSLNPLLGNEIDWIFTH